LNSLLKDVIQHRKGTPPRTEVGPDGVGFFGTSGARALPVPYAEILESLESLGWRFGDVTELCLYTSWDVCPEFGRLQGVDRHFVIFAA
jgi:hypothetical protein